MTRLLAPSLPCCLILAILAAPELSAQAKKNDKPESSATKGADEPRLILEREFALKEAAKQELKFQPDADGRFRCRIVSVKATNIDAFVFDEKAMLLAADTRLSENCELEFFARHGTAYRIVLLNLGRGDNISRLTIREAPAAPLITFGADGRFYAEKQLVPSDPRDSAGKHFHQYDFPVVKGGNYQIDQRGNGRLDSYLILEDSKGRLVAQDDDSGGFPHARIRYTAVSDDHFRLKATTYRPGDTGTYQLTVVRVGSPGPGVKE